MTREEKYRLERALIELENATQEIVDYSRKKTFLDWFDDPVKQIEDLFQRG